MKPRLTHHTMVAVLAASLLAGCSSVKLNIDAPEGVVIKKRQSATQGGSPLVALGAAPMQVQAKCSTPAAMVPAVTGGILTMGIGIPIFAFMVVNYAKYDYVLTVDQKTLLNLGFTKTEAAEAMAGGGMIALKGYVDRKGCNQRGGPHQVVIGAEELKAVLLQGGVGRYRWNSPGGEYLSGATYSMVPQQESTATQAAQ